MGGQHHAPAALPPEKTRYPLYRRLGGLEGWGKSRPPTGIRSPDRPVRSESLYRLSYRGPPRIRYKRKKSPRRRKFLLAFILTMQNVEDKLRTNCLLPTNND